MSRQRKKPRKKAKRSARSVPPFPFEFRLKVARLYVEDGHPAKLIASQFNISDYSVYIGQVVSEVHLVTDEYEARGYVSIKSKMEQEVIALQHLSNDDEKIRRLDRCIAQVQAAVDETPDLVCLKQRLEGMRNKLREFVSHWAVDRRILNLT